MSVNIGGDVDDPTYRYKMPRLQTKVEGRGNGIKTVIPNMIDVARALHRPPAYPTKFFGCELGAQSKYDEKTCLAIVNGNHDTQKLVELLNVFIEKFVLCPMCKLPEADIEIDKKACISLNCKACGHVAMVDMRHNLTKFILNHPPDTAKKAKKSSSSSKKSKEGKKEDEEKGTGNGSSTKKSSKEKKEKKEGSSKKSGKKDEDSEDDDVEWFMDTSAEAVEARRQGEMKTLTARASELIVTDYEVSPKRTLSISSEKSSSKGANGTSKKEKSKGSGSSGESESDGTVGVTPETVKMYAAEHTASELAKYLKKSVSDEVARTRLVFEALFSEDTLAELKAKKSYLKKVVTSVECQKEVLALLQTAAETEPAVTKSAANILKLLYDEDIVAEEVFLKWHADASSDSTVLKLKEKAKPFIEWLENADEDSDEEED